MWTSVPQIVVVVMRIRASLGPIVGDGLVGQLDAALFDEDSGFHPGAHVNSSVRVVEQCCTMQWASEPLAKGNAIEPETGEAGLGFYDSRC